MDSSLTHLEVVHLLNSSSGRARQANDHTPMQYTYMTYHVQVIKGFDMAVTGLAVGETRKTRVPPGSAYGERDTARIMKIPASPAETKGLEAGAKVKTSERLGFLPLIPTLSPSLSCSPGPALQRHDCDC